MTPQQQQQQQQNLNELLKKIKKLSKPIFISGRVIHGFGRGSKKLGCPTANLENEIVENINDIESGIYFGFAQLLLPSSLSKNKSNGNRNGNANENHNDNYNGKANGNHNGNTNDEESMNNNNSDKNDNDIDVIDNNYDDLRIYLKTSPLNPIYPTVLSLGWNPHFNDVKQRTLEAHLLHKFNYDFYNQIIRIAICGYIRSEKKFSSLQELIRTIQMDINLTKEILKEPERNWTTIINDRYFFVTSNDNNNLNNNHNNHHVEKSIKSD